MVGNTSLASQDVKQLLLYPVLSKARVVQPATTCHVVSFEIYDVRHVLIILR